MRNKKIIIPIILIVIILLAVLLSYFVFNRNNFNNSNLLPGNNIYNISTIDVAEDIKTTDIDKIIKEIIDASYKYYLLIVS